MLHFVSMYIVNVLLLCCLHVHIHVHVLACVHVLCVHVHVYIHVWCFKYVYMYLCMCTSYMCVVAEAINEVNSSLDSEDSTTLLQALYNQHSGLTNVQDSNALHYLTVLRAMRAVKIEVGVACKPPFQWCLYVSIFTYMYVYMYVVPTVDGKSIAHGFSPYIIEWHRNSRQWLWNSGVGNSCGTIFFFVVARPYNHSVHNVLVLVHVDAFVGWHCGDSSTNMSVQCT